MAAATEFFQIGIQDNNFTGYAIAKYIDLTKGFQGKRTDDTTKKAIESFLLHLYAKLGQNASNYVIPFGLGQTFEYNAEQPFFRLEGADFEEMTLYTTNLVGTVRYEGVTFNIGCRFGDGFLQYMIASAHGFLELQQMGGISEELSLAEWLLVYYWKIRLQEAFARGLYKTYRTRKEKVGVIKGRIDMRALAANPFFDGRTVCEYREHSYENLVNAVIARTVAKLFQEERYRMLLQDIVAVKRALDGLLLPRFEIGRLEKIAIRNPFYALYEEVYELSIRILKNDFSSVGEESEFSAFLFDISLLFEHHIRTLLIRGGFRLHEKNRKEFQIPNGIGYNDIYPDIVIDHGNDEISIYDVKYKRFDFQNGVNREDRFQLAGYVALYGAKYKIRSCGFIYPLEEGEEGKEEPSLQNFDVGVRGKKETIPFYVHFYKVTEEQQKSGDFKNEQIKKDGSFLESLKGSICPA